MTRAGSGALPLRTAVFWMHLVAGVIVGLVVLIMSVTGVLLAYERQILDWAATRHQVAAPSPTAQRLPLDDLLARARTVAGDREIVALGVRADPKAPIAVGFENRQNLFLDPYTAAVVGDDAGPRAFFGGVQRWHRWLALGSAPRSPVGKAITGAANLAFLFLIVSGLYLWWPRQWSARAFRAVMLFTRDARGKARDWNWHHVLGFWSAPALILIVASGAFISYAWPGELMKQAFGEPRDAAREGGREGAREGRGEGGREGAREGRGEGGRERAREGRGEGAREGRREGGPEGQRQSAAARQAPVVIGANLDSIIVAATRESREWRSMQLRLPREPERPVSLTITTGLGARPNERAQATFDARTGAMVEWQTYEDGSAYRRFRSWIRPIHTGEAAGLFGQTIAAIVSAAAVVLVWTGVALALRRVRATLNRRDKLPAVRQAA